MKLDNNHIHTYEKHSRIVLGSQSLLTTSLLVILLLFTFTALPVAAQQTTFDTAEAAADKLYNDVTAKDRASIKALFGSENLHLLPLEDIDEQDRESFINAWKKSHKLIAGKKDQVFIEVGLLAWTFPIPLQKNANGWYFDVLTGQDIIRTRSIGRNELSTMQAALAYYDAQKEYAGQDRNANGTFEYAQQFISTPGKKDGLYWPVKSGEPLSPLGSLFTGDITKGAYHGYYFKILKEQGKGARGGAYSYLSRNRMKFGFALLAWPAEYGETGVMSFLINHDGVLFEKDLGTGTEGLVTKISAFEPGEGWLRTDIKDLN